MNRTHMITAFCLVLSACGPIGPYATLNDFYRPFVPGERREACADCEPTVIANGRIVKAPTLMDNGNGTLDRLTIVQVGDQQYMCTATISAGAPRDVLAAKSLCVLMK
jgi:hypothetical protein